LLFLTGFNPAITNLTAFVVMTISIIGVLQSFLNKKKIQCACLGAVFNLPHEYHYYHRRRFNDCDERDNAAENDLKKYQNEHSRNSL
jgi:hypothetical protein